MPASEPKNRKALETGSGISWDEWLKFLEPHKELNHTEMAKVVLAEINEKGESKSPEWWAQGVTVAYEQYIGRRQVGQQCDGKFSVTVSITMTGDMTEVLARIIEKMDGVTELDGVKITRAPSTSETEKWRYWRCGLEDGSNVAFNIQTKPSGDKSSVAINHDKLQSTKDVERWRAYWKTWHLNTII